MYLLKQILGTGVAGLVITYCSAFTACKIESALIGYMKRK